MNCVIKMNSMHNMHARMHAHTHTSLGLAWHSFAACHAYTSVRDFAILHSLDATCCVLDYVSFAGESWRFLRYVCHVLLQLILVIFRSSSPACELGLSTA